jgi:uncharacterized protein (TIGR02466 family)
MLLASQSSPVAQDRSGHMAGSHADTQATIESLEARLELESDHLDSWASLGVARARSGQFAAAIAAFRTALHIAPGHVISTAYLGSCLHLDGREAEARDILDYDGMVDVSELQPGADPADVDAFNAELARQLTSNSTLTWELKDKAIRGGYQTRELLTNAAHEVLARFEALLGAQLSRLLNEDGEAAQWKLTAWGVSLQSGGYQLPHVHPRGLLSGVYYVQMPPPGSSPNAGALRFRRDLPWLPRPEGGSKPRVVLPRAGTLIVFPSYFWHDTVPFESETPRISIAFDMLRPSVPE